MRVVSLVNGSLLSEAACLYAITYAKSVKLPLTLLFIDNGEDSLERFHHSESSLKALANAQEVEVESVILQGDLLEKLRYFVQLYAVDTLFCATRKLSNKHSISDRIIRAKLETGIAVVKIKSIPLVRSYKRVMLCAGSCINPHAYLLWLGLLNGEQTLGKLFVQNGRFASKASTKSGLKYAAAPYVQLAQMLNHSIEVVNTLKPINPEEMNNYLVANDLDLVVYDAQQYAKKVLNQLTDVSSTNSIMYYCWKV